MEKLLLTKVLLIITKLFLLLYVILNNKCKQFMKCFLFGAIFVAYTYRGVFFTLPQSILKIESYGS